MLEPVVRNTRSKRYPKGQIILYEGDMPLDVLILMNGIVKVYDIGEQGNEKVLHLLKSSSVLPLAFFSGDNIATRWFYAALTDCEICVLPREQLIARMRASNELTFYLMNWFSREVHELLVRLSSLSKTNSRGKIVAALKFLATHHAQRRTRCWWRVTLPVNQQLLADMTGITRESAATIMRQLQAAKLVRVPRLTVLEINVEGLVRQAV